MTAFGSQLKTVLLLGVLAGLALGVGYIFGGTTGLTIAFIIALIMNGITYFWSDKIVLFMYRAKEASKEEQPELHSIVEQVAVLAGIPKPKVYIMESATPNAFATGRNPKNAVVCCTTSIMRLLSKQELKGVIAHEMAHIKNRDILIMTIAATVAAVISYVGMMARWVPMGDRDDNGNSIVSILLVGILTPLIAMILQFAISRSREYLADASGARYLNDGASLANALAKLEHGVSVNPMTGAPQATASLFIVNPFSLRGIASLLSTHPPMDERIRRLKNMDF
jgi:heat shock protein HtpX